MNGQHGDLLIIGAGLAGLTAGWQAAQRGAKVRVIAKGWGATHWLSGCVDLLGYYPVDKSQPVKNPAGALATLIKQQPHHPYARAGRETTITAIIAFQDLCNTAGYPLHGSPDRNWLLPSAVGAFRPTCLAPETMIAGDLTNTAPMLIVGFKQLLDFYPHLIADNLKHQGISARHLVLDLPSLEQRRFNNPASLARMMEDTVFRSEIIAQLKPQLQDIERVGFPAVLGLHQSRQVHRAFENRLRRPVFEIPSLTPSVPGMRLHHILVQAIKQHGGRVFDGMEAQSATTANGQVTAVHTETAARQRAHRFHRYLLATGGILGGGIDTDYQGNVREVIFDLPVQTPAGRQDWFRRDFLDKQGHPIYQAGLRINSHFQPLDGDNRPVYDNLFAAGTTLAGGEVIRERSFEGVAIATGYAAGTAQQKGETT